MAHEVKIISNQLRRLCAMGCVCAAVASAQAGSLQVTVLDRDGKPMPDAVVIVVPATKGVARNPPPTQAVITQEKMQFVPAVTVVSPGARVRFTNGDPWDHHVRISAPGFVSGAAGGHSLRLEGKSEGKAAKSVEVTMDQAGAQGATLLGCFIHGSMSGHVFVADSPWTLKTGPDGVALFDNTPEGVASVKVWHAAQLVEPAAQKVLVGATPGKFTVQLDVVPRRRRV
jgi:plastocyanin